MNVILLKIYNFKINIYHKKQLSYYSQEKEMGQKQSSAQLLQGTRGSVATIKTTK